MATITNSSQALAQLQAQEKAAQNPSAILTSEEGQYGVPAAQQQVSGLQKAIQNSTTLLNNVAPSVYGRTANSLVTNAQANAQIANEQAPINTQLNKETRDLSDAQTTYQNALSQAMNAANLSYQGQQDKLSYLQNLYSALLGKEQTAASLAEQKREADLSAQTARETAASSNIAAPSLASLLGGSSGPKMTPKNGVNGQGGYAFTSTSGNPISAATYARITGISLGDLLHQMGSSGDTYAQQAYNEISANKAYYAAHPEVLQKEFSLLF